MRSVEPDLKLSGLSLWVFGRQFPDAADYWDGNWLNVRARVEAPGAVVEAKGAFVNITELAGFAEQLQTLHASLVGEAALCCLEPNLKISVQSRSRGHIAVNVTLTPDHLTQSHEFKFDLDQSYLGPLLDGCESVLSRWPVRSNASA